MEKILVIEDSEALLKDILEMLSLEGYNTVSAANGLVGIQKAEAEQPDVIVCDIRMPVMDGYTVLAKLRKNPSTAHIPFIFLTARTGRSEMREGMQLGADDYLTKPFTADELVSSIHTRLERRGILKEETERKLDELRKSIVLALPHEIRTPLNVILGFSELLVSDGKTMTGDKVVDMATHVNDAAKRLYQLTESYVIYTNLEIARSDQKKIEQLRQAHTPYGSIIVTQEAHEKAIHYQRENDLVLSLPESEPELAIDGENLARIFNEILDNAFKFSHANSPVEVQMKQEDAQMHFVVSDHGNGMPTDKIDSIGAYMQFERHFWEQSGVGLGLSIASRIIELYGGRFMIESELEQYTTVHVWLPCVLDDA